MALGKGFAKYLVVRITSPIGVLAQFALLGRQLSAEEFARFLMAYSIAAVFSQASDGGQHVTLFSAIRGSGLGSPTDVRNRVAGALATKLIATMLWAVLVLLAEANFDALDTEVIFLGLALGAAMPVGDVFMNVLRGFHRAELEFTILFGEYSLGLLGLYCYSLTRPLTATSAILLLTCLGLSRTGFSLALTRSLVPWRASKLRLNDLRIPALLKEAVPVTLAALMGVGFSRLPSLTLHSRLSAEDYAVIIAFLSLFGRGELVVSALMQTGFRSDHSLWRRAARHRFAFVIVFASLAIPVLTLATTWPTFVTRVYLGPTYVDSARFAAFASVAMLLYYPLYGCRLLLQFSGRHRAVLTSGCLATGAYFAVYAMVADSPGGAQLLPYFAGLATFLILSTRTLIISTHPDEI